MRGAATLLLFVALATISSSSLIPDEGLTKSLKDVLGEDKFAISVNHVGKSKKKATNGIETFFTAEHLNSKSKFILMIDRRLKKVILEIVSDNQKRRAHIVADSLGIAEPFRSLVLVMSQRASAAARMEVYVDCVRQGELPVARTLRQMAQRAGELPFEVHRERRYRMKIHDAGEIDEILRRENCLGTSLYDVDAPLKQHHHHNHQQQHQQHHQQQQHEQHHQKQHEHHQSEQQHEQHHHRYHSDNTSILAERTRVRRRGDIPGEFPALVDPSGCFTDELMAKTLNQLIDAVKKMWTKLDLDLVESKRIRELLENCAACQEKPTPPPPLPRSCRFNSPCYPGADCRDTPSGPQCLRCPVGYYGDGRNCRRYPGCGDNPCFEGVDCMDTATGFSCGPCPRGYTGNGQHCERINGCQPNPCFPNVSCAPSQVPPYFRCGSCPAGYNGNGLNCHREDECDLAKPCWQGVRCYKYESGYRCDSCPEGMTGNVSEGRGVEYALSHRQYCYRIDPCSDSNGGCVENSDCFNSEVTCT